MKYYAYIVPKEKKQGVSDDWKKVEKIVSGKEARYKSFNTKVGAEAWLASGANYGLNASRRPTAKGGLGPPKVLESGIYFDAGTGRGYGVEISVTDEKGKNLLHKVLSKKEITKHGKHLVGKAATNNYGELLAMKHALTLAMKEGVKKIFGDSKLVIDYWSKWIIKRKEVAPETVELAMEVSGLREEFEEGGGSVSRVSGAVNPADLGFHR